MTARIPLDRQIAVVRDELRFREHVYSRRVADRKMTVADKARRIAEMEAVLATLLEVQAQRQPALL